MHAHNRRLSAPPRPLAARILAAAALAALVGGCVAPPDQPAYFSRMGRFLGLVANCGCSDISPERMKADFRKAVVGRYSEKEIAAMAGYVNQAATEYWDNQKQVCVEVCSQRCMVTAVVEPLGAKGTGEPACLVSERDLHLTDGAPVSTLDPTD